MYQHGCSRSSIQTLEPLLQSVKTLLNAAPRIRLNTAHNVHLLVFFCIHNIRYDEKSPRIFHMNSRSWSSSKDIRMKCMHRLFHHTKEIQCERVCAHTQKLKQPETETITTKQTRRRKKYKNECMWIWTGLSAQRVSGKLQRNLNGTLFALFSSVIPDPDALQLVAAIHRFQVILCLNEHTVYMSHVQTTSAGYFMRSRNHILSCATMLWPFIAHRMRSMASKNDFAVSATNYF